MYVKIEKFLASILESIQFYLILSCISLAAVSLGLLGSTIYYGHLHQLFAQFQHATTIDKPDFDNYSLQTNTKHLTLYLLAGSIYLASLALIGCLGAFYNSRCIIRIFSLLAIINVALGLMLIFICLPTKDDIDQRFVPILKDSMEHYNWKSDKQSHNQQQPTANTGQDNAKIKDDIPKSSNEKTATNSDKPIALTLMPHQTASVASDNHKMAQSEAAKQLWDQLQFRLECCGLTSGQDWIKYSPNKKSYPKSCCRSPMELLHHLKQYDICNTNEWITDSDNNDGCRHKLTTLVRMLELIILMGTLVSFCAFLVAIIVNFDKYLTTASSTAISINGESAVNRHHQELLEAISRRQNVTHIGQQQAIVMTHMDITTDDK